MEHFYDKIHGWFTWPCLYRDMVAKFPSGSSFVEVGVFKGRSLSYLIVEMINANKEFSIIGIDLFVMLEISEDIVNSNLTSVKEKFNLITGNSVEVADSFKDESLDFVFIDGDHAYESIKEDILAWMPKIKNGGILAGHDYPLESIPPFSDIKRAVDEILGEKNDKKYINELCWLTVK